jgi:hypothetical protein
MANQRKATKPNEQPQVQPLAGGDISASLRQIANCLGYIAANMPAILPAENVSKDGSRTDPVALLFQLGFERDQIATIAHTTINAVNLKLSRQGFTKREKLK